MITLLAGVVTTFLTLERPTIVVESAVEPTLVLVVMMFHFLERNSMLVENVTEPTLLV